MFKADVEAVVNAAVGKKEQMNHNLALYGIGYAGRRVCRHWNCINL